MSKAWVVGLRDSVWGGWGEYCFLVHAENRGQAKSRAVQWDPGCEIWSDNFTEIRAIRFPKLDGVPFTLESTMEAGFYFSDEDGEPIVSDLFVNDCHCDICRGVNAP